MNITLRQLKAFAMVARHKSFTRAAHELHLTQSSLSGLIKEMERHLNTPLFERTTRQTHLTDAGSRLLPHVLQVLQDVQLLNNEIDDLKDFHQGKVRLAAPQELGAATIAQLIWAFKQAYPDILVTLIDCLEAEVIGQVQGLNADLGISLSYPVSSDLFAKPLFEAAFYLVVRPNHALACHQSVTWQTLSEGGLNDGEFITLQAPFAQDIIGHLPIDISTRLFRSDYQVNFLSTALGMVKKGIGMTMALDYARPWIQEQGLVMIPVKEPVICRKFLLYGHRQRVLTPAVATFLEFAIKHFSKSEIIKE